MLLTIFIGASGTACSSTAGQPAAKLTAASAGVCDAEASLPDVALAEQTFLDEAHGALHQLAATAGLERSLAASLLEAKAQVESDFTSSADATTLAEHLAQLRAAADAALTALGEEVPPCAE